jgi:hypothetical protein
VWDEIAVDKGGFSQELFASDEGRRVEGRACVWKFDLCVVVVFVFWLCATIVAFGRGIRGESGGRTNKNNNNHNKTQNTKPQKKTKSTIDFSANNCHTSHQYT